jgi:uncharacterized membrane protein
VIGDSLVLPEPLRSTVESSRALLSTVAGATITVAGIAFSITLLLLQLTSSQYSPRVLQTFYKDPLNKHVMGLAAGTFTYCLVVLRTVHQPAVDGGSPLVPHVSTAVGLLLGVISIIAIIAFIDHGAHGMEAAEIVRRITDEATEQISTLNGDRSKPGPPRSDGNIERPATSRLIHAEEDGWVRWIDHEALYRLLKPGGIMWLHVGAGEYVMTGIPIASVVNEVEKNDFEKSLLDALHLGRTRTMQQDMELGFRQLADIALRALSPGVNDPTTAQEAIVHIGSLLREVLLYDLPDRVISDDENRRIVRAHQPRYETYVDLAFTEIRHTARDQVMVVRTMLRVIDTLSDQLDKAGLHDRASLVKRQRDLLIEECEHGDLIPSDLQSLKSLGLHGSDADRLT